MFSVKQNGARARLLRTKNVRAGASDPLQIRAAERPETAGWRFAAGSAGVFFMDGSTHPPSVAQLAHDALALPASARADLAHRLLISLDESHDDDAEAFALREALRRSDEIDRGVVRLVPAAEAMERLRAGLRR